METGCVASGVQDPSRSMCSFESKREFAILPIEWDVEIEQVLDSLWRFSSQHFDGRFIAEPGAG